MERLDTSPAESYVSCAIYGKSGSGKTTFGVTAPKPLILLSERQGLVHIKQAAARLGIPVPPVLYMTTLQDYRNAVRALYGAKDRPFQVFEVHEGPDKTRKRELLLELPEWPQTVVIDSVTDVCRIVIEEIREQSPPKLGADGLPTDSQRFWQVLSDRARNVVMGFRDAPVHRIFLALADDRIQGEGDDARRQLTLDLPMRKLPEIVTAAVNCVGYAFRKEKRVPAPGNPSKWQTKLIYGVMTTGPEFMTLKPYRPLRDTEVPDFSHWVKVIQGELTANAVPAPDPSQESLRSASEEDDLTDPSPSPTTPVEQTPAQATGAESAAGTELAATDADDAAEAAAEEQAKLQATEPKTTGRKNPNRRKTEAR